VGETTLGRGRNPGQIFPDSGNDVSALDSVTILREIQCCSVTEIRCFVTIKPRPSKAGFAFLGFATLQKILRRIAPNRSAQFLNPNDKA
jgi:hypothetical protein